MKQKEQKRIFNEWLRKHKGLFFKVIHAYAFEHEDRNDLFQEISIQVWNSIPRYRAESSEATWIYKVAFYTAIAWSKNENRHIIKKEFLTEKVNILTEVLTLKDPRLDWLYAQIGQLNEIDRSLTLLLLDDYSYKEMANIIGISESNVGVKINRIKKFLIKKSENSTNYEI